MSHKAFPGNCPEFFVNLIFSHLFSTHQLVLAISKNLEFYRHSLHIHTFHDLHMLFYLLWCPPLFIWPLPLHNWKTYIHPSKVNSKDTFLVQLFTDEVSHFFLSMCSHSISYKLTLYCILHWRIMIYTYIPHYLF